MDSSRFVKSLSPLHVNMMLQDVDRVCEIVKGVGNGS